MALNVVIMAAGKGTRMRSATPKVLHRLAGRSLLGHVLGSVQALGAARAVARTVVVTGYGAEAVEADLPRGVLAVRQAPQLGTGHAVLQALPALEASASTTLILNGDVPLITAATAQALADACAGERLALLTVSLADATGYGRIVRARPTGGAAEAGSAAAPILAIVEHKDADTQTRAIREVYTGMMAAPTAHLQRWVAALTCDNAQGEFYLTDIVAMAVAEGLPVVSASPADDTEVLGVNSPAQLADLERRLQRRQAEALMDAGVRLADPARFDLRGTLDCGSDVEIDVNCVFEGQVQIGARVRIGAHCVIRHARIEDDAVIHAFSHIDGGTGTAAQTVVVGPGALVGPYARLRPGAVLGRGVHIGNFVEVKNSTLGEGAKANHLAYLGDAMVGAQVNFGAGSITANYDGVNKHRTQIGDHVLVGSNCVLVAPVSVGSGATLGAGTTLSKDAPAGILTVARARQTSLPGWQRPQKTPPASSEG